MSDFYTDEKRNILKSKSAFSLPSNPSDRGFNADQIKRYLYQPSLIIFDWLKERDTTLGQDFSSIERQLGLLESYVNANRQVIIQNSTLIKHNQEQLVLHDARIQVNVDNIYENNALINGVRDNAVSVDENREFSEREQETARTSINVPSKEEAILQTEKGQANGVPTLDSTGKIPTEQLPSNGIFKYKGQVPTYNDLPKSGNEIGDTYDVKADGKNYVWNGTSWDDLGGETFTQEWKDKINNTERKTQENANKITNNTLKIERKQDQLVAGKNITIADDGVTISANTDYSSIPVATPSQVGGVKANATTTSDNKEVHIDSNGFLKVATEPAGDKARVVGENLIFESAVESDTIVPNNGQPAIDVLKTLAINNKNYSIKKPWKMYEGLAIDGTFTVPNVGNATEFYIYYSDYSGGSFALISPDDEKYDRRFLVRVGIAALGTPGHVETCIVNGYIREEVGEKTLKGNFLKLKDLSTHTILQNKIAVKYR